MVSKLQPRNCTLRSHFTRVYPLPSQPSHSQGSHQSGPRSMAEHRLSPGSASGNSMRDVQKCIVIRGDLFRSARCSTLREKDVEHCASPYATCGTAILYLQELG